MFIVIFVVRPVIIIVITLIFVLAVINRDKVSHYHTSAQRIPLFLPSHCVPLSMSPSLLPLRISFLSAPFFHFLFLLRPLFRPFTMRFPREVETCVPF